MISRHLVDPELAIVLESMDDIELTHESLATARVSVGEGLRAVWPPDFTGVRRDITHLRSQFGDHTIRVVVLMPTASIKPVPVVLHMHSGGMIFGAPEDWDGRNADLVRATGVGIVSVDYRLAPETQAPGNVDDCYSALAWINAGAHDFPFDLTRVALMGESAGGGLAASLALMARDRGEFSLNAQFLTSPMLDDRTGSIGTKDSPYGRFVWRGDQNQFGWDALLGAGKDRDTIPYYCTPARATDLTDMPMTYISVGAIDLFLLEDIAFSTRLADAGVPVELHVYPGAFHGFELARTARISVQAEYNMISAIRRFTTIPCEARS